jgi:hypothetical protein
MSKNYRLFGIVFVTILLIVFIAGCFQPKKCVTDEDCVPAQCCHPTSCVHKDLSPDCTEAVCTMDCRPDTMDCEYGYCVCIDGECEVEWAKEE